MPRHGHGHVPWPWAWAWPWRGRGVVGVGVAQCPWAVAVDVALGPPPPLPCRSLPSPPLPYPTFPSSPLLRSLPLPSPPLRSLPSPLLQSLRVSRSEDRIHHHMAVLSSPHPTHRRPSHRRRLRGPHLSARLRRATCRWRWRRQRRLPRRHRRRQRHVGDPSRTERPSSRDGRHATRVALRRNALLLDFVAGVSRRNVVISAQIVHRANASLL